MLTVYKSSEVSEDPQLASTLFISRVLCTMSTKMRNTIIYTCSSISKTEMLTINSQLHFTALDYFIVIMRRGNNVTDI